MYLVVAILALTTTTFLSVNCMDIDGYRNHFKEPVREDDDFERIRQQYDLFDHLDHSAVRHRNEDFDDVNDDVTDDISDDFGDRDNEDDAERDDEGPGETVNEKKNHQRNGLCQTPACIKASASILTTMNTSVEPCDDFYDYVCGKFPDAYEPFEDMKRAMSFEIRRRKNSYDLHRIITKLSYNNELKSIDSLKAAYDSCMDEKYLEKHGVMGVKKIIARYGPWPLDKTSWSKTTWNFKKTLTDVTSNLPISVFLNIFVALDPKNPDKYMMQVHQSVMGLPKDYYHSKKKRETKVREAYFNLMLTIMKLLGYKATNLKEKMKQVFQFEVELSKISMPGHTLREVDKLYKKMTIQELEKLAPNVDMVGRIKKWLKLVSYNTNDVKNVIVIGEKYVKDVGKLISKTPKETLANFLLWKIAVKFGAFGGKKFSDARFAFNQVYYGAKAQHPRWYSCISIGMSWMPFAIGRLYVDNNFKNKHAKSEVTDIIQRIKQAFTENLHNVHWMDSKTRQKAKSKAQAILQLVGYPDYILDNKKLDAKYASLSLKKNDFLGNYLSIYLDSLKKNIEKLKQTRDRTEWNSGPEIVNAFYSSVYNRIVFPAGILQPLYYHPTYPPSLKFGGIGTVVGHELTHAFDDHGRKYDATGHLRQWWEKSSIAKFKKVADCIRNQYSNYKVYNRSLNGKLSCGENMADNGGVKLAYKAYKDYINDESPALKKLPGLEHLSNDQLFYIAFAKIWCVIESKAATIKNIYTDPHSYPKFRVIGTLSNSAGFSNAFQCKPGSRMNPVKKCKVW